MPARPAPQPVIDLHELRACTDVPAIFALFGALRYPIEHPAAVPLEADDLPGALRDLAAARYVVAEVAGDRPGVPPLLVTLFILKMEASVSAAVRGIAQAWPRRFAGEHLLVFAREERGGFSQITLVNARRLGEGARVRVKLYKLIVDRAHPTRHDVETLNGIAVPASVPVAPGALFAAQCAAFNVESITERFYVEYARRFKALKARLKDENKGIAAFYDVEGRENPRLHTFAQRLFGRLMFLYFLQKKRALNGDPDFVTKHYRACLDGGEHRDFYRSVLEPLFFQTLNEPRPGGRSPLFGTVPYLNGGLFAPDDDDLVGSVYVANDIFDPNSDEGLLYFLNTHNFTIQEDTPLEVEVALDPEMLGKVFENLLEADERGRSGTFYTPRPVVAFMCREALAAYLTRATGIDAVRLGWLLDEAETGDAARDDHNAERLTPATLDRPLREHLEGALLAVRVLDPAVGSGAFPLGMLALLVGVRRALYRVAEAVIAPRSALVEGWKRDFIRDCLYGVDIKREAIEIARLRLWLSLVVDADPFTMEPLPNLDYKLMDGDSLIETLDGVAMYPTRPEAGVAQGQLALDGTHDLVARLGELQRRYFQPGQADRDGLKRQIREAEYAIMDARLTRQDEANATRLNYLLRQLSMLQGRQESRQLNADKAAIEHDIAVTHQARADLAAGKTLPFFLFRLHFAPVFDEKDGFDIVIANPPYVRHERVDQVSLATLRAAYPDVQHGMADLFVYFYARGLQLLREGGTLAFISSNKFFRAGYGRGLRDVLTTRTSARDIIDFGDFPVFDAAAYPCIVITDKGAPAPDHAFRGLTVTREHIADPKDLDQLGVVLAREGRMIAQAEGAQPPAGGAATSALVAKLLALGTPLGQYAGGKIYYGIKTGLNEAFVVDQATRDRLIAEDPRSAEALKPFLRGRDVGRYTIHSGGLYLIRVENGWTMAAMGLTRPAPERDAWPVFCQTYPALAEYLTPFADRARMRDDQGHYWWELRPCVYYEAFEQPKIIYPDIAPSCEFSWDCQGFYMGNTLYFVSTQQPYLCGLLNSHMMEYVYATITNQIRGGYFRFFSQYMEHLPIVEPVAADQARLAAIVDELQALGGQGPRAETLEREADAIVCRTYRLTPGEIAEIERWHAGRRATLGRGRRGVSMTTLSRGK